MIKINPLIEDNVVIIDKLHCEFRGNILTNRQMEILSLLSEGYNSKQIAEKLIISNNTVKIHMATIYSILLVKSVQELIVFCYRGKIRDE